MNLETLKRSLFFILIAAGIYGAVIFLYLAVLKIHYPYMINLGEPPISEAIRLMSEGKMPYLDLSTPPFRLVPYGPVYLGLVSVVRRLFSMPFVSGRLLTWAATMTCSLLIYLILKKWGAGKSRSLLAALFFISIPYVCLWGVLVNVDMTGVMLDLAAFFVWWCYTEGNFKSTQFLTLGIFLSTAAFFTKSSMITAPAAFFCYLVFQKKYKTAASLFLLEATVAGLIFAGLNQITHGKYFFHTFYEISKRQFFAVFIYRFWWGILCGAPALVVAGLSGLWNSRRGGKHLLLGLYVFFALILTVSLGKQGSDTNYFLPLCAISSLALGMTLEIIKKRGVVWAEIVVYALLLIQLFSWIYPNRDWMQLKKEYQASRQFFDKISLLVQKSHGDILSEDMSLLVANGREIYYEPFPMGQMTYRKVWNPKPILDALDQQYFSIAILYFYAPALKRNRTFPPEFLEMFNKRYQFVGQANPKNEAVRIANNPLYFYIPRKINA